MLIKKSADVLPSEITSEGLYRGRRRFLGTAAVAGAVALAGGAAWLRTRGSHRPTGNGAPLSAGVAADMDDELTPYGDITSYVNFYEFTSDKQAVAGLAQEFPTDPWSIRVSGECENPKTFAIEDILAAHAQQERVYRLRCVEAWSMVIPWLGFPLGDLLRRCRPTSKAKFVELTTIYDPEHMPGQRRRTLPWPYVEGLRIDEAMHPLAILATGLYGKSMPKQNGAPLRLVVPWKYGFKSIKSIVQIRLTDSAPETTWNRLSPHEYGFYANVNPGVDHPRWSQRKERRIGEIFKRPTLLFNGYGDQVAHLYSGMDLHRYF